VGDACTVQCVPGEKPSVWPEWNQPGTCASVFEGETRVVYCGGAIGIADCYDATDIGNTKQDVCVYSPPL
jgi:hypothetical protein